MAKTKKESVTLMDLDKGDSVYMYLFSGAAVGRQSNEFKIKVCTDKTITVETGSGTRKFSRKTGIQIDPNKPRYSNFILAEPNDEEKVICVAAIKALGAAEKEAATEAKKVKKPKAAKASEEDEYEDAEDTKEAKPKAKGGKTSKAKKSAKKAEEDEDLDD